MVKIMRTYLINRNNYHFNMNNHFARGDYTLSHYLVYIMSVSEKIFVRFRGNFYPFPSGLKKTRAFKKNPCPVGFFGFYWFLYKIGSTSLHLFLFTKMEEGCV
uniref:Uncharacterized protein n=1 Tax=Cacopsylla melanoneura TaxID=428564 RepID=A0A8D8R4R4_9HEMI